MKDDEMERARAREVLIEALADDPNIEQLRSGKMTLAAVGWSTVIDAMLAFAQQPEGWRPIETAPKDGEPILIWKPNERMVGEYMMAAYWDNSDEPGFVPVGGQHKQGYLSSVTGTPQGYPTHWRPLPAPPAAMLDVAPIPGEE